ncbi:sensor protein [Azorhizobium caulinodans ORS 571]|uniref:histidine kinase n=1 Tax=Azorhizobium caulinodans (strain ATCC 43989 / DSM 5975 / JCM 20966 / LMG 6465 / NBRC 14845 / NCIMB 13405 / ORS 571) TaxID=438753 RepID=A8HRC8_AZOC5|nr:ATP-binding protein [Azorhizobium caulinodans]BAF87164.1 sensor protein [Azorhizobium caulinodans ORS 571]
MRLAATRRAISEIFDGSYQLAINLFVIFLLIAALVGGTAAVLVELNLRSEIEEAELNAQKTAYILLHNFEQTVEPIDALLLNIANAIDGSNTPTEVYDFLRGLSIPPSIVQLAVADTTGMMIASNLSPPVGERVDLSDREHIRVHMGPNPHSGLFISKPVLGRVSKRWTIQFSRAWYDHAGQFRGVVIASYNIFDFISFYSRLRIDPNSLISLIGTDGVVRARAAATVSFGEDVRNSPAFTRILRAQEVPYDQVSGVDGIDRVGYYVRSDRYPIVMLVAYDKAYIRGLSYDFRITVWITAACLGAVLFVLGVVAMAYHRLQQRVRASALREGARQREVHFLEAMAGVPGVCVVHVTDQGSRQVGDTSGSVLPALIHDYVASPRFRSIARSLTGPQVSVEYFAKEGEEFEVQMMIAPLEEIDQMGDGDGSKRDLVVFAVDQTSKRIEENNLYQMSKLASLGEVATGLAHEINQPLGVIRLAATNALTGLQKGMPVEHMEAKLKRIIQQTVRMSRIIDHMRIFGRKSGMRLEPSDPMEAVDGALQVVGAQLRLENVSVAVSGGSDGLRVLCRQDQLEQVVINLLQNARDAIRDRRRSVGVEYLGAITIEVSQAQDENRAPQVLIRVKDNAGGIPENVIDKVFQPFFTTKPPGQGTGLGLSVSFGIIRDHGGTLSVENAFEGAVFTIRLPSMQDSQSLPAPQDMSLRA